MAEMLLIIVVGVLLCRGIAASFKEAPKAPKAPAAPVAAFSAVCAVAPVATVTPVPVVPVQAAVPPVAPVAPVASVEQMTDEQLLVPAICRSTGLSLPSWLAQAGAKEARRKAASKGVATRATRAKAQAAPELSQADMAEIAHLSGMLSGMSVSNDLADYMS